MLENLIGFLHVAPLAVIAAVSVFARSKSLNQGLVNAIILVLTSIGILAGAVDHDHHAYIVDPCFGYVLALLFVAVKSAAKSNFKVTSAK
jgi:integral membrane sensor domain MASE1